MKTFQYFEVFKGKSDTDRSRKLLWLYFQSINQSIINFPVEQLSCYRNCLRNQTWHITIHYKETAIRRQTSSINQSIMAELNMNNVVSMQSTDTLRVL